MKETMSDFLSGMVDSRFERLETLMLRKYPQFTNLFWMLKSYASSIKSIRCLDDSADDLVVVLETSTNAALSKIREKIDDHENVSYEDDADEKRVTTITMWK